MPAWLGLIFGCLFLLSSIMLIIAWKSYKNYKHICDLYQTLAIMRYSMNRAHEEIDNFLRSEFEDYKNYYKKMDI